MNSGYSPALSGARNRWPGLPSLPKRSALAGRSSSPTGTSPKRACPSSCSTTAGSGTEILHATIFRDDAGAKFVVESPLAFPTIALLDPATLATCPPELAAGLAHSLDQAGAISSESIG